MKVQPTLQSRLAGVLEHLDAGGLTAADARTVADALADARALRARLEDALESMARGEWSSGQAQELADALRQWAIGREPEP